MHTSWPTRGQRFHLRKWQASERFRLRKPMDGILWPRERKAGWDCFKGTKPIMEGEQQSGSEYPTIFCVSLVILACSWAYGFNLDIVWSVPGASFNLLDSQLGWAQITCPRSWILHIVCTVGLTLHELYGALWSAVLFLWQFGEKSSCWFCDFKCIGIFVLKLM